MPGTGFISLWVPSAYAYPFEMLDLMLAVPLGTVRETAAEGSSQAVQALADLRNWRRRN